VINAALGFDTFLVQRHGLRSGSTNDTVMSGEGSSNGRSKKVSGSQLGCYFCSDVVAPGNVSVR